MSVVSDLINIPLPKAKNERKLQPVNLLTPSSAHSTGRPAWANDVHCHNQADELGDNNYLSSLWNILYLVAAQLGQRRIWIRDSQRAMSPDVLYCPSNFEGQLVTTLDSLVPTLNTKPTFLRNRPIPSHTIFATKITRYLQLSLSRWRSTLCVTRLIKMTKKDCP